MTKVKSRAAAWRNRIVEKSEQRADQFVAHPDNYRLHSTEQEAALTHVLGKVGWVQDVIVSKRSGYLLDGHLRVKAALARGDGTLVPYKVVDVSEADEALILSTMDPIGALARADREKVDELIALLPDEDDVALARLLHGERKADKKLIAFEAETTFSVIVECQNETQQAALVGRLRAEGYTCRTE